LDIFQNYFLQTLSGFNLGSVLFRKRHKIKKILKNLVYPNLGLKIVVFYLKKLSCVAHAQTQKFKNLLKNYILV